MALLVVLAGLDCRAQFELKRGSFNQLYVAAASVPGVGSPSITTPQFKAVQATSAASSARAVSGAQSAQYPSSIYRTSYPSGAPTGTAMVLVRSSFGNAFASGVPKYLFADVIFPPLAREGGSTTAEVGYWRPWPVQPGETFSQPGSSAVGTPVRFASIRIDVGGSGYTSAPVVTITGGGGVGAAATAVVSGGAVTAVNLTAPGYGFPGIPVGSIAAPASGTRATATAITEEYAPSSTSASVYYSPHAGKVFASQAGRVSVTWVTSAPQTVPGSSEVRYLFRQEIFNVSSASSVPTRRMYWTEKEYTAPPVALPAQGVQAVAPVYNANFPAMVGTDFSFGYLDPNTGQLVVNTAAASQERRTLWYQNNNGIAELHAYNVEGRILIEYLGPLLPGESVKREYLGADVVDVLRVMPTVVTGIDIGDKIRPQTLAGALPDVSSAQWRASPVTSSSQTDIYYGTLLRSDGTRDFYAEKENADPDRVVFHWLESRSAQFTPPAGSGKSAPTILWPVWKNAYSFSWPSALASFVHYLVPSGGSSTANGVQLAAGKMPQVVYQDDPAQREAALDVLNRRLTVSVPTDGFNRTLLKFSSDSTVWYVRLFSQAVDRTLFQEPDGAVINGSATVGQRLVAPSGYATAGYIQSGRNYLEAAYKDPASLGVAESALGAIIPVNARPQDKVLKVWWYKEIQSPGNVFGSFFVPSKQGTYTTSFPTSAPEIVMASNAGSGPLTAAEGAGSLHVQNVADAIGYNPNEEHAVMTGGVVYALRDDLNNTSAGSSYTSEKFVLLSYTSPTDGRPAMTAFKVLRENATYTFNYPVTAGTMLQPPMPLAVLPLALDPSTKVSKNREATVTNGSDSSLLNAGVPTALRTTYQKFTFKDRKGFDWVYRGPHATSATNAAFGMQFWYPMQSGFFIPGLATQPTVGTPLPFLLPASSAPYSGSAVSSGDPVVITYRPAWPQFAPTLRVAETLTLPKSGLPTVYGQTSAQVLYQQSYATDLKTSVVLHDSFREKALALGSAAGLLKLPVSIATVSDAGKTYFQRLPPHLQRRFYYDPLRGNAGTLVLLGQLVQEPVGESYLNLNVLSGDDLRVLGELVGTSDPDAAGWATAIASLATTVETFRPDAVNPSLYRRDASLDRSFTAGSVVEIGDPESAVVNYALTAPGAGAGWVTLVFGGGSAFTPGTEPVDMQILRVVPDLYPGEMKVLFSENPLDEQVTLRHTADFRGQPGSYEFEWRYAQPGTDGQAPAVYAYAMSSRLQSGAWKMLRNPTVLRPAQSVYDAASTVALARQAAIKDSSWTAWSNDLRPGIALRAFNVDFSSGVPVRVIFSAAALLPQSGWELYVNNVKVLTYKKPGVTASAAAASGLLKEEEGGLPLQFELPTGFFTAGSNQIEVLLFTSAAANTLETLDFRLHAAQEADQVVAVGSPWVRPNGDLTNIITVGGSPTNPLSTPLLMLGDNYFTMRYRPKPGSGLVVSDTTWSRWADPKLVEGFVKRALAGINPFNQRIKNFGSASIDTDVSVLTEAGKRWEGNVALSLANINTFGLIEIYETLLNRARAISIDSGYDDPSANNALLLAAGYLNDLYVVLGNEAFADAANSTIAVDQGSNITTVNTSRFTFEGQVANVLEEELGLLRGRDDLLAPGVRVAPIYNRMYWNFTRGINSGEAFYALNYNIREAASGSATNGTVDAADAQWMFPQGHGDAYGHYLTAVKGYYRLLQSPKFTWSPRAETVTVLGQPVTVDYYDERRFADSAASVARSAQQILNLTYRQAYQDGSTGWGQFRDGRYNSSTGVSRYWGVDEWASRSIQGAYFNWLTGNSMVPDFDADPNKSGVQRIDRTTVTGLSEIAVVGGALQSTLDSANARLNPLGLSPGAIAFDISPTELKAGKSHFEQVYDRALQAALNAKGAFDQASKMSAMLRGQENQSSGYLEAYINQEAAFNRQLIEIFGLPYSGEIGAGRTYAQGYDGPDTLLWFLIDRPAGGLVDTESSLSVTLNAPTNFTAVSFTDFDLARTNTTALASTTPRTITINQNRFVQFADNWAEARGGSLGTRPATGNLQQLLLSSHMAQMELIASVSRFQHRYESFLGHKRLLDDYFSVSARAEQLEESELDRIDGLRRTATDLAIASQVMGTSADLIHGIFDSVASGVPDVIGFSNDALSGVEATISNIGVVVGFALKFAAIATGGAAIGTDSAKDKAIENLPYSLGDILGQYPDRQVVYELQLRYREAAMAHYEVAQNAANFQRAAEAVNRQLSEGNRLLAERSLFRQRAAAVVQGYRTRDVVFRTFRNEALEQYRTLFDLASRYTYLAAKSYDYETGLLGSAAGRGVLNSIVSARSIGDLTGNVPRATAGSTGDAGLAGAMAKLQSDWSVAKSRLGINNPDQNGTVFSLRRELFRIRDDPAITTDDTIWRQTLEQNFVPNLLADPDVALLCRNLQKPDGSSVPGVILSFRTAIQHGQNFFGLSLAEGDHAFSASNYSTKIYSVGVVLSGYVGIDPNLNGSATSPVVFGTTPNALSATPYVYLIPTGTDYMRAPPLGDTDDIRGWQVADQALPLPYNLGATKFSSSQYVYANGSLMEVPWVTRRHNAFRAVSEPSFFYSSMPAEFTSSRLVGRSVWNSGWKIVIPAYTLHSNEQEGLNRFAASVSDIKLFLRTYSNAGN